MLFLLICKKQFICVAWRAPGAMFTGATCISSTAYTVSLKNRTSTPLSFTLVPKQIRYPQLDSAKAGTGLSCFSCELLQGVILGSSSVELVFHFRPQRPGAVFVFSLLLFGL